MVIVAISDTHQLEDELDVPAGDVLVHAGDFTMFSRSFSAIESFNTWLGSLPHRHKLVGYGNHEFAFEADPNRSSLLDNGTVLVNAGTTIKGLNFWFSPVTPLYGGAFGLSSPTDRARHWATIPEDTHVLVTHGPPYGILDQAPDGRHMGDPELLAALERLPHLRLHIFGHEHSSYGRLSRGDSLFVNASMMGSDGDLANKPIVIRIQERAGPGQDPKSRRRNDGPTIR